MKKYIIVFIVSIVSVVIYDLYIMDAKDFFYIQFKDILVLIVMAFFTIKFTDSKSNIREKKRDVGYTIKKIIQCINNEEMHIIDTEEKLKKTRIIQRTIFNDLELLNSCSEEFNYVQDYNDCYKHFKDYWDDVSCRINNISDLKANESLLQNHLLNLESRLKKINFNLYS